MYSAGLGLEELGRFADHDGFDGVMLGWRGGGGAGGAGYHLEFTMQRGHAAGRSPGPEHLLVFYVDAAEWPERCEAMDAAGFVRVTSSNPYWEKAGATFEDVEGYRVVVVRGRWGS
jgi:hypothetical protein